MKINTTRFGEIEVAEDKIISMPGGMIGFTDKKRFVIVQHKEDSPFFWYQSLDDPALAFVLTNPHFFLPEYSVDPKLLKRETGWALEKEDEADMELYVTVRIPPNQPEKMTANLIGPIVLNNREMQAVQLVLARSKFSHRHPLMNQP